MSNILTAPKFNNFVTVATYEYWYETITILGYFNKNPITVK